MQVWVQVQYLNLLLLGGYFQLGTWTFLVQVLKIALNLANLSYMSCTLSTSTQLVLQFIIE
jgi:hypothetical protein